MTNDDIFHMAETHGWLDDFGRWNFKDDGLLSFVADIQKAEREACAKVCDFFASRDKLTNYYAVAANAIRARGDAVNISQERVDETAKGEHEPVAWLDEGLGAFYWAKDYKKDVGFTPLYTAPPKREWVGITLEEIDQIYKTEHFNVHYDLAFAIEAKLREKNI